MASNQAAQKPRVPPPPKLAPNTAYGLLNPGTTTLPPGTTTFRETPQIPPDDPRGDDPVVDWAKTYFGSYGLPRNVIDQINNLGKKYGTSNPNVFFQSAQDILRSSDWFKGVFPGFDAGVRAGLFTDETGYRGYVNNLNNVYQQYLGRHVSGDETAAALGQGVTPDLIGRQFQGDAISRVNGADWQYLSGAFDESGRLTDSEKTALGREQAGIDTPLGQMVAKRVQQAAARAQTIFGGTIATPSLSLANGRLSAPSLGSSASDIGA